MQDEILKVAAEAAVQRREAAEASATPDERIAIQHAKAARAKELRKKEVCEVLVLQHGTAYLLELKASGGITVHVSGAGHVSPVLVTCIHSHRSTENCFASLLLQTGCWSCQFVSFADRQLSS